MTAAVSGTVLNAGLAHTRRPGFRLFSALVQDDSGQIQAVWPNQAFLKDVIKSQQHIVLFGKVEDLGIARAADHRSRVRDRQGQGSGTRDQGADQADAQLHTGRIVPVYERTGSVTTNMQRRFVWQALEQLPDDGFDPVPADILTRERWPSRKAALWAGALSRRTRRNVEQLERVHDAGAAAAGLRGLLRLPDRARAAASRERAGAQGAGLEGRRSHPPVRRARCCRSS